MPRILYLLNISNPSQLSADSGWQFADLLAPALIDQGTELVVAAPARVTDERAHFQRMPVPASKYRVRFDPGMDYLVGVIRRTNPDVVVANQIEAAPAIRAALLEAKSPALLAGYCHYLPFSFAEGGQLRIDPAMDDRGLGLPVHLAFAAGLAALDRVLVHSATAASSVSAAASRAGADVTERLRVVPAPRDERLVRDAGELTAPAPGEPVTGMYNHRLYAHYGTARFVKLADRLTSEAEVQVRLRVMDLFGQRSPERIALDDSPERMRDQLAATPGVDILTDGGDRTAYRNLLVTSNFALAPFRPGCPWAMSVVDCQGMGLPVIAPRTGWFAEHIDDELLFSTSTQALALVERLATDPVFYLEHAKRALASTADFHPALVAARYLEAVS
ncbi:glycosyltransferase family protein [Streptacidiphilus rugosus]|uniref:glycosyltransferase family 1 protein n=1 Tax=Streptacidiphilus rugosus TaxID=405783 RepID=UPI00056BCFCD|nr:glycosyltransferase family 1 protein [Streptacidiphilus rugosus]